MGRGCGSRVWVVGASAGTVQVKKKLKKNTKSKIIIIIVIINNRLLYDF